ncbi:MAG: hypothetical protein IH945_00080 [Armatimonadetes bacterium]|nr:hypothetical protein [Armatimonadota bacterium]
MYKVHIKRTAIIALLGLAAGLAIVFFSPKIYEGRLEMLLGTNTQLARQVNVVWSDEIRDIVARMNPQGLQTERQLLNSEAVFFGAIVAAAPDLREDWEEYYLMYDVVTARTANQNEDGPGVAQIQVRAHDPDVAREITDAIPESYNRVRQAASAEAIDEAVRFLTSRIATASDDLLAAENLYAGYKSEIKVAAMDQSMVVDTNFRATLISSLETSKARLDGTLARMDSLELQIEELPGTVLDSESDVRSPMMQMAEADIASIESELGIQSAKYTGVNPKIKTLNAALADARARLAITQQDPMAANVQTTRRSPRRSQLELELSLARAQRADLIGSISGFELALADQETVLAETPAKEVKLNQLKRDLQVFDNKYRNLKIQLEELQNRSETGPKQAVVLAPAFASEDPVAPEPVKFAFIGFMAGAAIGLVMSFALESLRPRVYTSVQLAELTGLQVVASIPVLPGFSRSRAVESLSGSGAIAMESFRNMAYSYLATRTEASRTIMFTGIGTAGSSSLGAAQFAVALAQAGTKVVLVDAERTRQVITNGFAAHDRKGVSDAFQSGAGAVEMLVATQHENLRLLPIGTVPEAMMSEGGLGRVDETIAALRSDAEVVVIAVAPTDVVADAAAFASRVDEVFLSVSARTNEYGAVPTAFDILEKAGARSIKLILTDTGGDGEPFAASTAIQRASWR